MSTSISTGATTWRDARAISALGDAAPELAHAWMTLLGLTTQELPPMGLSTGERPAADVEVLAGALAALEFELARHMHAADRAGALPLPGPGAMLSARAWSVPWARRLARAGQFAADHPTVAGPWASGLITSEHVDAVARNCEHLATDELQAVLAELEPFWGVWSPTAIARFVRAAARMLHPAPDGETTRDESDAHASRGLSFSVLGETVLLSGELPRLEGEVVMAAIDAFAERLRTEADHVPASARRADALVELVNAAHARDALPSRGGLPVGLTVTLATTTCGDPVWSTSLGHHLTAWEQRFAACDAQVTPLTIEDPRCPDTLAELVDDIHSTGTPGSREPNGPPTTGERVAALAALLAGPRLPLAVGRTSRTATPAQRRAMAARDRGCIIPGCQIPAEACQSHHINEWAAGGATDVSNMALLCWTHHRQVDLRMWEIRPGPALTPEPARGPEHGSQQAGSHLAGPECAWPGNNGSPWTVRPSPRRRWRL